MTRREHSISCHVSFTLAFLAVVSSGHASQECIEFIHPVAATQVAAHSCTLSIKTCDDVRSVVFRVQYMEDDGQTLRLVTLGNITRPPFKLVWDLWDLPNQLGSGATVFAEAKLRDGRTVLQKQKGVFLVHRPVSRPEYAISYRDKLGGARSKPMHLHSSATTATGKSYVAWNEKNLLFTIDVHDPFFYSSLPKKKMARMGVEILIDPEHLREPFASGNVLMYSIPLDGKPVGVRTSVQSAQPGSFDITREEVPCAIEANVVQADFKGYTVTCAVAWHEFGGKRPKAFGCNVLAKALDKGGAIRTLSWTEARSSDEAYSPYMWGNVRVLGKPLLANTLLLWLASLVAGLAIGASGAIVVRNINRFGTPIARFELSEEEEHLYESLKTAIHDDVTNRSITVEDLSLKLAVPPRKLNQLIKRNHGESFKDYLMRARVEIAKERLRSSHSSEAAIASSCGFASVDEMEKYFRKFCRTTPLRFRERYQVT